MHTIEEQLKAPFPPSDIKSRKSFGGNKKTLHYIDVRSVMERLDSVVGFNNWQTEVRAEDGKTICELSIRIDGEWIHKTDGAGDTNIEADKGAISDAIKRAAVSFGIGRYLYEGKDPIKVYNEYHKVSEVPNKKVDFMSLISKAKTSEELEALKPELGKLPEAEKDQYREAFATKLKQLIGV